MSKEDIDRAVKDAEKFADEDNKAKEAVDTKNHAENLIFQTEKTLSELGDKVSEEDKAPVNAALETLKSSVNANADTETLKSNIEALEKAFYAISEKLYAQNGQAGAQGFDPNAAGNNGGAQGDGTYYNADYEDKTNK